MCPGAFPGGELQLLLRGDTLHGILLRGGADEVLASRQGRFLALAHIFYRCFLTRGLHG